MPDPLRIEADYLIETAFDPAEAAEAMAGEQSSGTFVAVPGETPELKARSAARVERLDIVGEIGRRRFRAPACRRAGPGPGGRRGSRCPGRSTIWGPPCRT